MADQTADDDFVAQALAQAQMAVEEISDEVGDLDNFERDHGIDLLGDVDLEVTVQLGRCLLYTSPSPRDLSTSRMPSSA